MCHINNGYSYNSLYNVRQHKGIPTKTCLHSDCPKSVFPFNKFITSLKIIYTYEKLVLYAISHSKIYIFSNAESLN